MRDMHGAEYVHQWLLQLSAGLSGQGLRPEWLWRQLWELPRRHYL
jgi:hypothetical protein